MDLLSNTGDRHQNVAGGPRGELVIALQFLIVETNISQTFICLKSWPFMGR